MIERQKSNLSQLVSSLSYFSIQKHVRSMSDSNVGDRQELVGRKGNLGETSAKSLLSSNQIMSVPLFK